jgi:electron transport complex protein RnfE
MRRLCRRILVIATFVTIADYVIQAISLDLHQALGAFVFLIAVNCLILARAEAFASKHTVGRSLLDGLGMGAGFTVALCCLGAVREVLGADRTSGSRCSTRGSRDGRSCCCRAAASSAWRPGWCCLAP